MSRTAFKKDRVTNDGYQTPVSAIEPLLPYINFTKVKSFYEPCAGDGNILDSVLRPMYFADHNCKDSFSEITTGSDYFKDDVVGRFNGKVDLIVTNPPFSQAIQFLQKSLLEANTVIYLLRLNFLAAKSRKEFFEQHKPDYIFVLSKRPCFVWVCSTKGCSRKYPVDYKERCVCGGRVKPGTDATEYAWFVWDKAGVIKADHWLNII